MKQVRMGVFETNSSSSHALVMGTKEEYALFKNGKMSADINKCRFVNLLTEEEWESDDFEGGIYNWKELDDCTSSEYKTSTGDTVVGVAFEYPC